jgi:hypothetical protein
LAQGVRCSQRTSVNRKHLPDYARHAMTAEVRPP